MDISKKGDSLTYTGNGFLSYDPADNKMIFLEEDKRSLFGVWVEYRGKRMLVMSHDISKSKQP